VLKRRHHTSIDGNRAFASSSVVSSDRSSPSYCSQRPRRIHHRPPLLSSTSEHHHRQGAHSPSRGPAAPWHCHPWDLAWQVNAIAGMLYLQTISSRRLQWATVGRVASLATPRTAHARCHQCPTLGTPRHQRCGLTQLAAGRPADKASPRLRQAMPVRPARGAKSLAGPGQASCCGSCRAVAGCPDRGPSHCCLF
jgi:hypothetical protein